MSPHVNDLSAWTIERVNDALVEAISQTPSHYRSVGRALARAVERFLDGAFLASYGDVDEAAALMSHCLRHISEAQHLCQSEHVTARLDFMLAADALPDFAIITGEEA